MRSHRRCSWPFERMRRSRVGTHLNSNASILHLRCLRNVLGFARRENIGRVFTQSIKLVRQSPIKRSGKARLITLIGSVFGWSDIFLKNSISKSFDRGWVSNCKSQNCWLSWLCLITRASGRVGPDLLLRRSMVYA